MKKLPLNASSEIKKYIKSNLFLFIPLFLLVPAYSVFQFLTLYFAAGPLNTILSSTFSKNDFGESDFSKLPELIVFGVLCTISNLIYKYLCERQLKRADKHISKVISGITDEVKSEEALALNRAFGDYIDRFLYTLNVYFRDVSIAVFIVYANPYIAPFFLLYEILGFLLFFKKKDYSKLFLIGSNIFVYGYIFGSLVLLIFGKVSSISLLSYYFAVMLSHSFRTVLKKVYFGQKIAFERIEKLFLLF